MTPALRITSVDCDREQYRDLLLLADEQWDMVELYLHRGDKMTHGPFEPFGGARDASIAHHIG